MRTRRAERSLFWMLVTLVLVGGGAAALITLGMNGSRVHSADARNFGGAFSLVDQNGTIVTQASFRGKPLVLFFGYTHCHDVCSTALADMSVWQAELGSTAELPFVFVTVDPQRDTPEVLRDYLRNFAGRIVALTGTPESVKTMLGAYHIVSIPVVKENPNYEVDHTATIFLIGRDGSLVDTIRSQDDQRTGLLKIRKLLSRELI